MESIRELERDCVLIVAACLLLPACGAESPHPGDSPEYGDVATIDEALFESACWTQATADAQISYALNSGIGWANSPNALYDHAGCPNQWIVDVTSVFGKRLRVWTMTEGDDALNPDWCPGVWNSGKAMGWRPSTLCTTPSCGGGQWESLGAWERVGHWTSTYGCHYDTSGVEPILPSTHGYTRVRVVARAQWLSVLRPVTVRSDAH